MSEITIITDTREQLALDFSKYKGINAERHKLDVGDYSILGFENKISFERKSIPDIVGTLIGGHERFLREMERAEQNNCVLHILIEHSPSVLYEYCKRHNYIEKFDTVIQSLFGYARHGVYTTFCKDRKYMTDYIVRKAREYVKTGGNNDQESSKCL